MRARLTALTLLLAGAAGANEVAVLKEPRWLSEVFTPDLGPSRSFDLAADGIVTEQIDVRPLSGGGADAVGVLPSDQSGIPVDIWGNSEPEIVGRLITPYLPAALPEITALWHRLALAETAPPRGAGDTEAAVTGRVDHLLNAGALDQAEALLDTLRPLSKPLFRRAFDVGLLAGRANAACNEMRANPALSPSIKARIFCLARGNDWAAAALTLTTAETLGQISRQEADLIARFLDPDLFENEPPPPPSDVLSALEFTMREALVLPRATGTLPLAFLHGDMDITSPWRNRVMATERLVRSHAIPPARLIELYQQGKPAASGGIWVRVEAVQSLLASIEGGDEIAISSAFLDAHAAMAEVSLGFALVEFAVGPLRDLDLSAQAARLRFDLWLMSPEYAELVWDYEPASETEAVLRAVALGRAADVDPGTDIEAAALAGLTQSALRGNLIREAENNRRGEAILKALKSLVDAGHADPRALETLLVVLRRSGLEDEARRIALQALLAAEGRL